MTYIQIEHEEGDRCLLKMDDAGLGVMEEECRALFEEGSVGDSIRFSLVEINEEEFKKLPEFKGW